MKIGPREQLILVIVGLAAVLVAIGFLLVLPQYQKLGKLDDQIATAQQQVQSSKTLLAQREQIKNRAAETDAKALRLANLVPESPDLPSLIIELQDVAFASGVQLQTFSPAELAAKTGYSAVPISIGVVGTWSDTVDFLSGLSKIERGVRVVDFSSAVSPTIATADPTLPNYSETTQIHLEAYAIPASAASTGQ